MLPRAGQPRVLALRLWLLGWLSRVRTKMEYLGRAILTSRIFETQRFRIVPREWLGLCVISFVCIVLSCVWSVPSLSLLDFISTWPMVLSMPLQHANASVFRCRT